MLLLRLCARARESVRRMNRQHSYFTSTVRPVGGAAPLQWCPGCAWWCHCWHSQHPATHQSPETDSRQHLWLTTKPRHQRWLWCESGTERFNNYTSVIGRRKVTPWAHQQFIAGQPFALTHQLWSIKSFQLTPLAYFWTVGWTARGPMQMCKLLTEKPPARNQTHNRLAVRRLRQLQHHRNTAHYK